MNLKTRLEAPLKSNIKIKHKNDSEISEIFVQNEAVEKIISENMSLKNNFILTGQFDCDKTIVYSYIKKFEKENSNLKFCGIGVKGLIGIFENILAGINYNAAGVNIKSYLDVIENLKLLMSANMPNLTENKLEHILKVISPVIIHSSKDEDGLFYIEYIGLVEYNDNELTVKDLYKDEMEKGSEEEAQIEQLQETKTVLETESATTEVHDENTIEISESDEPKKNINKYKLLREKVRNKKLK